MSNEVYAVYDIVNKEYLDETFLSYKAAVQEIAWNIREMQSRPEDLEHLDDYTVVDCFSEDFYKIKSLGTGGS